MHSKKIQPLKTITLVGLFFLVVVGVAFGATYVAKHRVQLFTQAAGTMPIKGTFFLADLPYTSDAAMEPLFADMRNMGIDTLIFVASGILDRTPCMTGSTGPYREASTLDPASQYRMGMRLAKKYGMKIYMGTTQPALACIKPWEGNINDPSTDKGRLIDYNDRQIAVLEQIFRDEGWNIQDDFFQGFYVSNEMDIRSSTDPILMDYYTELTRRMKARYPNKYIVISPWIMESTTYTEARQHFINIYTRMSVDIIAPQDSMGTKKTTTYARNSDHFRALRDARDAVGGKQAWANIESITESVTPGVFEPTDINRLTRQIESAQPYVTSMITWIYQHTLAIEPRLNGYISWSNAYSIPDSVKRMNLRYRYDEVYVNGVKQIDTMFIYGQNLVIKGPNLGNPGTNTTFIVTYINTSNQIVSVEVTTPVFQEDMQTAYISMTRLSAIDTSKPYTARIRVNTTTPPPSPTPIPTPTPWPTPSPTPIPTAIPTPVPTPTPTPNVSLGDGNFDGKVDGVDYMIWRSHYGQFVTGPRNGDFDSNGRVDGVDYMIWRNNYQR